MSELIWHYSAGVHKVLTVGLSDELAWNWLAHSCAVKGNKWRYTDHCNRYKGVKEWVSREDRRLAYSCNVLHSIKREVHKCWYVHCLLFVTNNFLSRKIKHFLKSWNKLLWRLFSSEMCGRIAYISPKSRAVDVGRCVPRSILSPQSGYTDRYTRISRFSVVYWAK